MGDHFYIAPAKDNTKNLKMTKVAKRTTKASQSMKKKVSRKSIKSRPLRKLQKSRPKRYMNPFLCFAHEERKKWNSGRLLSDWRAAHKGLGSKWRALGAGKLKFHKQGKVPAFAMFVKQSPQRKEILPAWRTDHKGLGGIWRGMDKANKAKYVSASKQLKGSYDQQMNLYRKKRQELVKSIRIARLSQRVSKKQRKLRNVQAKKVKAAGHKASKGKRSSRKLKKAKTTLKEKDKKSKAVKRKHGQIARDNKNVVPRKINARIRVTRITSRVVPN